MPPVVLPVGVQRVVVEAAIGADIQRKPLAPIVAVELKQVVEDGALVGARGVERDPGPTILLRPATSAAQLPSPEPAVPVPPVPAVPRPARRYPLRACPGFRTG